jgi:uncharacterized UBP type Zn finger protein
MVTGLVVRRLRQASSEFPHTPNKLTIIVRISLSNLLNISNTCYQNASFQALLATSAFRRALDELYPEYTHGGKTPFMQVAHALKARSPDLLNKQNDFYQDLKKQAEASRLTKDEEQDPADFLCFLFQKYTVGVESAFGTVSFWNSQSSSKEHLLMRIGRSALFTRKDSPNTPTV